MDGCAHLYGNFGAADVEAVQRFVRDDGSSWARVFDEEGEWLK